MRIVRRESYLARSGIGIVRVPTIPSDNPGSRRPPQTDAADFAGPLWVLPISTSAV
jgi:hypothetical protein